MEKQSEQYKKILENSIIFGDQHGMLIIHSCFVEEVCIMRDRKLKGG